MKVVNLQLGMWHEWYDLLVRKSPANLNLIDFNLRYKFFLAFHFLS